MITIQATGDDEWIVTVNAGATNQLLAGLALLVVIFYLRWNGKPVFFLVLPLLMMLVLPAWALEHQMLSFFEQRNFLLIGFSIFILMLQAWMVVEAVLAWRGASRRVPSPEAPVAAGMEGGRAC